MVVRKHISFEKEYINKMQPFLTKHDGNFSAAIRDIIDLAITGKSSFDHSNNVMFFDSHLANLLLNKTMGMIPDKQILDEIADPLLYDSISNTIDFFNAKFAELGWDIKISMVCDNDIVPTTATVHIIGKNYLLIDLTARIFSLFLAVKKCLGIETIHKRTKMIELVYKRRGNSNTAIKDLKTHLGIMQDLFCEIEKQPDFWQMMVRKYRKSNYKMIAVHFKHYEDLLAKKVPTGEISIELLAKSSIRDIPHRKFLVLMKEVYESAGIIENIDIEGDTVKVFHSYRDPQAVDTLQQIFMNLFRLNGHTYEAQSTNNLIIFYHMPEIGIRISEMINNLNKSNSKFDSELITFLTFLNGLKDETEICESLRILGYMMSKKIFEEYQKEHNIYEWDLKNFQEALTTFDSKIGRLSECSLIDENGCSMNYKVNECNLVNIGGDFNIDICQFSRGFFQGAVEYAFRNNAQIKVIKQLTHGDDRCEVILHVNKSIHGKNNLS